jgi:ribosome biogenesis GTPase / thiamine phosphate phosphatase
VMVNEHHIASVILLSKCDLKSQEQIDEIIKHIVGSAPNTSVVPFSNHSGLHLDKIQALMLPGLTYCLLGSSGVGKTTLLNSILGAELFETQSVSKKDGKGKHTTTNRELVQLDNGAMLIDTPGMRELGNFAVDTGIDETFSEILKLATKCKFSDCQHTNEKGCAIQSAIREGLLSDERYQNYLKMKNESAFSEMSYYDKRQKDKRFGKLIKATLSEKIRK